MSDDPPVCGICNRPVVKSNLFNTWHHANVEGLSRPLLLGKAW